MTEDIEKFERRSPGMPARQEDNSFMAMVERISSNPNVDVQKLEKILDMQERILDKNAQQLYNSSMVKAQSEMPEVPEDARNQQTQSNYSKVKTIIKYCAPIWTKHGFSQTFYEGKSEADGMIRTMADVMHEGGHSKTYWLDIPLDDKGIKGSVNKTQTHAKVSSLTYGQSKLLKMIYNIPTGEGDDDGNAAGTGHITEDQVIEINDLIKETSSNLKVFLKVAKADCVENIASDKYPLLIKQLHTKRDKMRQPGE